MSKKESKIEVKPAQKSLIGHFKSLNLVIIILIGIFGLFILSFGIYSIYCSHKIFANQSVGGINLAFKSKNDAKVILEKAAESFSTQNIALELQSDQTKKFTISPTEIGLKYDAEATVNQVWENGRNESIARAFWQQLSSVFVKKDHLMEYSVNDQALGEKIAAIALSLDQPEKDFSISYSDGKFTLLTDRQNGNRIDQALIKNTIKSDLAVFNNQTITFSLDSYEPKVSEDKAQKVLAQANQILTGGELKLLDGVNEYKADDDILGSFIASKISESLMELIFNDDRINIFIESIAKSINTEPSSAKLAVKDGKVTIFEASREGKQLDQIQAKSDIKSVLLSRISDGNVLPGVSLKISVKAPEVTDTSIGTLGINELIGTAQTDFKGSPANRTHNITVGAAALNGVLLKPGETFSTLTHLGTIDGSTGYLPELVIKDDRTVPEFGGGLCQVSSTLFRATLNAGMKIAERQNHKYRVSYYEPPVGMDATIYDPAPDFKFVNNYGSYVMIQSKIEKTKITFELYGTKDNRQISISDPIVYDFTSPDPTSYIETDTLAPGQTKLLEKAHQGASAKFDYKVTTVAGEILQEKTFLSKYIPWQERWLIGKGTPVSCVDKQQNNDETGVDCGGTCPNACPAG